MREPPVFMLVCNHAHYHSPIYTGWAPTMARHYATLWDTRVGKVKSSGSPGAYTLVGEIDIDQLTVKTFVKLQL